jgi:hypothetical protein
MTNRGSTVLKSASLVVALLFLLGVVALGGASFLFGSKSGPMLVSGDALAGEPAPGDAGARVVKKKLLYFNATKSGPLDTQLNSEP